MEIIEKKEGNVSIFKIQGRLDSNSSPEFEERIIGAIDDGARSMVVDFGELEYISSAGLRVILKSTKKLKRSEGNIILCAMQDYVREVFEISGFDSFLTIVPSMEDALGRF